MSRLPVFLKSQIEGSTICGHFSAEPKANRALLIAFPGGPGITGDYLDPFVEIIASKFLVTSGVMDLPNHDDSVVAQNKIPLSYPICLELLSQFVNEQFGDVSNLIFLGHSFGCRLILDLIPLIRRKPRCAILMNCPATLEASLEFRANTVDIRQRFQHLSSNEDFREFWRALIPHYFASEISAQQIDILSKKIFWQGNENMVSEMPTLAESALKLKQNWNDGQIHFVLGEHDLRQPDGYRKMLQAVFPRASFETVEGTAHYPMIEKPLLLLNNLNALLRVATASF